jgi:hypothetical protein
MAVHRRVGRADNLVDGGHRGSPARSSGVLNTTQQLGSAIGVAVIGVIVEYGQQRRRCPG